MSLSAADRAESWRDVVSRAFVPLDVELLGEEARPGRITGERLGAMRVIDVQGGPQVARRSKRLIARDGLEVVILSFQHRGTAVKEQNGRESVVGPGEFSLSDASRLLRKQVREEFRFTSFQFPREELRVRDQDLQAVTATTFSGREGTAAVVANHFAGVAREAARFDAPMGRQIAATAVDLLALLIDERCGRLTPQAPETAAAHLVRVKDHILRHLPDPGLSPSGIAAAHHMSVRYLHKLFQSEGTTVGGWIRSRRLERCRRDLLRSPALGLGVAAVGRRWGFVSASHFSRAFREAYGVTPREWQALGDTGAEGAAGDAGDSGRAAAGF
ncbi:helix-turn-helix domain-containing protein [Streptomyces sp. VRA16 Mangrove soil]|uniref:AraC-like ligand-binding domain-containing protein n=1 Tax=Streptomyces sp. VRA16 Mangrove soil TaxID=2817434 RepID=UPI001E617414|nr:helix-turn-helix domain-containing protein [Streptomyces sp. VRA16 Mangrove soil]